jgi:hypothetical protein
MTPEGCLSFLTEGWFWSFWQFVAVVAGSLLIVRQIKLQQTANLINVFNGLEARWESEIMLKARFLVCIRYLRDIKATSKAPPSGEAVYVSNFFEELGINLKHKILGEALIWEHYRYLIIPYFNLLKTKTALYRQGQQEASTFSRFEFLYERMLALNQLNGENFRDPDFKEIIDFLYGELDRFKFRSEGFPTPIMKEALEEFEKCLVGAGQTPAST